MRVEKIVRRKVLSNSRVDNTFDDFVCFFVITVLMFCLLKLNLLDYYTCKFFCSVYNEMYSA